LAIKVSAWKIDMAEIAALRLSHAAYRNEEAKPNYK